MLNKTTQAAADREREASLKALREELEQEIEEHLPEEMKDGRPEKIKAESYAADVHSEEEAKRVVEAILFTASRPVTLSDFKKVLPRFQPAQIKQIIDALKNEYEGQARSFRIQEVANGFECSTESKSAPWIMKLELQRRARQATQSALETLAILAYKQPITRAEIEELRGVDVSGVLSTLLEKNLVKIVGRKEVPGRPFLYGTTGRFLEHFGLKSLAELPDISEIRNLIGNAVRPEELLRTNQTIKNEEAPVEAGADGASGTENPAPEDASAENETSPVEDTAAGEQSPDPQTDSETDREKSETI